MKFMCIYFKKKCQMWFWVRKRKALTSLWAKNIKFHCLMAYVKIVLFSSRCRSVHSVCIFLIDMFLHLMLLYLSIFLKLFRRSCHLKEYQTGRRNIYNIFSTDYAMHHSCVCVCVVHMSSQMLSNVTHNLGIIIVTSLSTKWCDKWMF